MIIITGDVPIQSESVQKKNVEDIIAKLKQTYPNSACSLNYTDTWTLLVSALLSGQSTDAIVNKITPKLFSRFPTVEHFKNAKIEEIEEIIRPAGLYKRKAQNIKKIAEIISEKYKGKVPETMDELISLPGIGRKTANVVLGVGFNKTTGIVVDTHVKRLSQRLGWTTQNDPLKIEKDLMKVVPKQDWIIISHLLIDHGRNVCKARKPLCSQCAIEKLCPSSVLKKY